MCGLMLARVELDIELLKEIPSVIRVVESVEIGSWSGSLCRGCSMISEILT